jgi:hypothetical protein
LLAFLLVARILSKKLPSLANLRTCKRDNPKPIDWWGDPPDWRRCACSMPWHASTCPSPASRRHCPGSGNSTQDRRQDRDISAMCSMLTCDAATAVKPHKKMQLPPGAIASLWRPHDTHQHAKPLRDHAKGSATHTKMQLPPRAIALLWRPQDTHQHAKPSHDHAKSSATHTKMQLPPRAITSLWRPQDTHQHARPLRDHTKGSATHKGMQVQ